MTYIPKQTKLTKERVEAKLESGLAHKLDMYCEYLESDRDYIIGQALEIAFRKDKAFGEWLACREAALAPEPPATETAQAPERKPQRRRPLSEPESQSQAAHRVGLAGPEKSL